MNMTYRQLIQAIQDAAKVEKSNILDQNVSIFLNGSDEFMPLAGGLKIQRGDDVLDDGHAFLEIDF